MTPEPAGIVVVGASLAGLRGAEALRRGGYDGTLTLVGAEPYRPYDRPPLSKHVLAGELASDATRLPELTALRAHWRRKRGRRSRPGCPHDPPGGRNHPRLRLAPHRYRSGGAAVVRRDRRASHRHPHPAWPRRCGGLAGSPGGPAASHAHRRRRSDRLRGSLVPARSRPVGHPGRPEADAPR